MLKGKPWYSFSFNEKKLLKKYITKSKTVIYPFKNNKIHKSNLTFLLALDVYFIIFKVDLIFSLLLVCFISFIIKNIHKAFK